MIRKPSCFNDLQWSTYLVDLVDKKDGKTLDLCKDCTVQYQKNMRKQNKCEYPMKRIDKIQEFV